MTRFSHFATSVTAAAAVTVCGALLTACSTDSPTSTPVTQAPTAPASPSIAQSDTRGAMCGQVRGPDGALYVHALGTTAVDCDEAMTVAKAFGPKISAAKPVTVDGWKCTFPTSPGMLARCAHGDQAIGFFSSH